MCDCISWIFVKLFVCFIRKKVLHLFLIVCVHDYCRVAFVGWKHDDVCVPVKVLESQSLLSSDVRWREFGFGKNIGCTAKLGPLASVDIVS